MIVWGVYKNTDMTEGKGRQCLDRIFATEELALRWRATQKDYPGWPMHKLEKIEFDPSMLESFEGLVIPK